MLKKYDIDYSTIIKRDNLRKWAVPFVNGKLRSLFVPSVKFGREIVELIQRMDIDPETVTIDRDWDLNKWGLGDYYHKRGDIWDFELMYKNLERILTSDQEFDVMVIPGINGWGYFTSATLEAIKSRVQNGTGLVLLHPFSGEGKGDCKILRELSPLEELHQEGFNERGYPEYNYGNDNNEDWIFHDHYINNGLPAELFPFSELGYYPYKARGEVIIESENGDPIAAVRKFGQGRVVAFGYYKQDLLPGRNYSTVHTCFDSLEHQRVSPDNMLAFNYKEYFYGLIYKSMVWAADFKPETIISDVSINGDQIVLNIDNDTAEYSSRYLIKNIYNDVITEERSDSCSFTVPAKLQSGGQYVVDAFLEKDGKTVDWNSFSLKYPLDLKITELRAETTTIRAGEKIQFKLEIDGLSGSENIIELQVVDDFGRVIEREIWNQLETGDFQDDVFNYRADNIKSQGIRLIVLLKKNDFVIQKKESERVIVTPACRKIDDFEVFMSPISTGDYHFRQALGKRFREMGVTGLFPGDWKAVTSSGAEGLGVYWYDREEYTARKEKYMRTGDKKYLHRDPCLNDPNYQEKDKKRIAENINETSRYGPISYFANDEGSLTCYRDEMDFCFSPYCLQEMRHWLQEEYESLTDLNNVWGTKFSSWEEVVPLTREEALESGRYAPWADHRLFMEKTFAKAYKRINESIQSIDEKGIVRMSGTQETTAYTGNDYYLLHKYIKHFDTYEVGNQWEFHRSFTRPGTILGTWVGYQFYGAFARNKIWRAVYHGLSIMSIFWQYSVINPDWTFSRAGKDFGQVFREIKRSGIGKLLLFNAQRNNLGIALHYSLSSVHGTNIINEEKKYEENRDGWMELLEDLGYQYDFMASPEIEEGKLLAEDFKLLILPYSIALSKDEKVEIEKFVREGGTVLADFQTGLMDKHCRPGEQGQLDHIFGIERLSPELRSFFGSKRFVRNKEFDLTKGEFPESPQLTMQEAGIRAENGRAAYVDEFMKRTASIVTNKFGQGKGIYLNLSLEDYSNKDGGHEELSLIMEEILKATGIEKPVTLKDAAGRKIREGYETYYYSQGSARYIGVLKKFETEAEAGYDGIIMGMEKLESGIEEEIILEFEDSNHIYDVRNQKYLGWTDRVELLVAEGDNRLLALLPDRLRGIEIELPERVKQGEKLELKVKINRKDEDYNQVLNVSFYNPEGEYMWVYSRNHIVDDEIEVNYRLPYNEKKGIWRIVVRDTATGISQEDTFEVT